MMLNRSLKFFLYFTIICLIGLFAAYSSALPIHNTDDLQLKYPALVESIYQNHSDNNYWQEESLRNEFEKQIILIALADVSDDLSDCYQALKQATKQKDWQRYERVASDSLLFYMSYTEQIASKGISWLFGERIENNIGAPSNKSIDAFFNASSTQARLEYLQALLPRSAQHTRLYQNLFDFYLNSKNISRSPKFTAFAKQDKKLQQKDFLLARLQISGDISLQMKLYFESQEKELYSQELQEVIQLFQVRHGLKPDGIIGKNTRYWLNISYHERLRLMALNILRLQLWAINKPRMVLVNIPNYTMEYWEDGQKVFESKVIVGRSERKTPLFTSKLDSIVFNPAWNVPITIMREDILPKALSDSDYLNQHQYEIIPSWRSKEVIDPNQIEWESITAENFPYKLRQKPGHANALGLYKFNTPNKYAIYLHDTPAKYLFENRNRTYSSGCIRVQKAEQFVQLLMDKSGFSSQDYDRHHKEQKTSVVGLKKRITLYTMYQTVWVDESGFTQFRKDIYDYDKLSKSKIKTKYFHFQ